MGNAMPQSLGILTALVAALTLFPAAPGAVQQPKPKTEAFADLRSAASQPLDFKGAKAAVLIFLLNDCPISNYYTAEINALTKDYAAEPVRFLEVHVDPPLTATAAEQPAKPWKLT